MASRRALVVLALALFGSSTALAADGAFGLGSGKDGQYTGGPINTVFTTLAADVAPPATTITVADATGIGLGDVLLLWQPAGMSYTSNQTVTSIAGKPVAGWALVKVTSIASAPTLGIKADNAGAQLTLAFSAGITQVVKVPQYTAVAINGGVTVSATAWNGTTGGILAFLCLGPVTINGTLSADGAGFRGGQPDTTFYMGKGGDCSAGNETLTGGQGQQRGEGLAGRSSGGTDRGYFNLANAAGAGNCIQNGGGGGANAGAGGKGGNGGSATNEYPGSGGAAVAYDTVSMTTQLVMGGGGGAGNQSDTLVGSTAGRGGGGVIWFRAASLAGVGSIRAGGGTVPASSTLDDGQGGGGAGGSLYIRLSGAASMCGGSGQIHADGSSGLDAPTGLASAVGAGGGGGGGRLFVQDSTGQCVLGSSITVAGGAAGKNSAGASAGQAGSQETAPPSQYCSTDNSNPTCPTNTTTCTLCPAATPLCNTTDNHCVECLSNADCPASKPVCDANGSCGADCVSFGGDTFCTSRFGGAPGDDRYCDVSTGGCVQCKSNSAQCPDAQPVCTNDACVLCTTATSSVCGADHGGLVCDPSDTGGSGACVTPTMDMTMAVDLATPPDLSAPPDLSTPPDLSAPADLSTPRDLSVPQDFSAPADLAASPDLGTAADLGGSDLAGSALDQGTARDLAAAPADLAAGMGTDTGCGCTVGARAPAHPAGAALVLLLLVGLAAARRRVF